jgi:hypothetical protein
MKCSSERFTGAQSVFWLVDVSWMCCKGWGSPFCRHPLILAAQDQLALRELNRFMSLTVVDSFMLQKDTTLTYILKWSFYLSSNVIKEEKLMHLTHRTNIYMFNYAMLKRTYNDIYYFLYISLLQRQFSLSLSTGNTYYCLIPPAVVQDTSTWALLVMLTCITNVHDIINSPQWTQHLRDQGCLKDNSKLICIISM